MPKDLPLSVGVCGLYCGACGIWRNSHDREDRFTAGDDAKPGEMTCRGCRSDHQSKFCIDCDIRACADGRGAATCADCPDAPCDKIVDFDGDNVAHHDGVITELAVIRAKGPLAWADAQRRRWSCSGCGEPFSWYRKACKQCGADVPGIDERD